MDSLTRASCRKRVECGMGNWLRISSAIANYKCLTIHCACTENKYGNNKIMDKKYVIQCAVRECATKRRRNESVPIHRFPKRGDTV